MTDPRPNAEGEAAGGEPAGITQAEFAKRRGVSEAMVSRWKRKGLLVLADDGRVLEAASNARLAAMLDPGRGGDRTGKAGRSGAAGGQPGGAPADPLELNYQREAARDKRASALQRELELARDAKELLPAADVANRIAHHVRKALDVLAARRRRLAPKLALETDPRKVEQLLEESDREFCLALAGLAGQGPTDAESEAAAA